MRRHDPYRDQFASDGVFASGWRKVRTGGYVKAAGTWWQSTELVELVGELVQVVIYDYWMEKVMICPPHDSDEFDILLFCFADNVVRLTDKYAAAGHRRWKVRMT